VAGRLFTNNQKDVQEVKKLAAETQLLKQQLTVGTRMVEWIKAAAGLAGVITAIAALVGIYVSVDRNRADNARLLDSQRREQINSSISLIADDNTAKQLAGIASLDSFFISEEPSGQRQIFALLANILAVEENKIIRDAIVESFRSKQLSSLENSVLLATISRLTSISVSLVNEESLKKNRKGVRFSNLDADSIEARALSVGAVIQLILRTPVEYSKLSGIYCVGCDFSDLDLNGSDFSDSILYLADFSRAKLRGADFDGADLEKTRFISADLRDSKFTFSKVPSQSTYRSSYVEFSENNSVFDGPNFSCADLRNADFSGHPIFAIVHPSAHTFLDGGRFIGTDMAGVDFSNSMMFGQTREDEHRIPFAGSGSSIIGASANGMTSFAYTFLPYADSTLQSYEATLKRLGRQFSGSNWREAVFPEFLKMWFDKNPPPIYMRFGRNDQLCTPKLRSGFSAKLALRHRNKLYENEVLGALRDENLQQLIELIKWKAKNSIVPMEDIERRILNLGGLWKAAQNHQGLAYFLVWLTDDNENELQKHLEVIWPHQSKEVMKILRRLRISVRSKLKFDTKSISIAQIEMITKSLSEVDRIELSSRLNSLDKALQEHITLNHEILFQLFRPHFTYSDKKTPH